MGVDNVSVLIINRILPFRRGCLGFCFRTRLKYPRFGGPFRRSRISASQFPHFAVETCLGDFLLGEIFPL